MSFDTHPTYASRVLHRVCSGRGPRRCAAVLLCALLGAATLDVAMVGTAGASVVQALSLEQLTQKADVIVVGVAGETQSRHNASGKLIVTDVSVQVQEGLKGAKKGDALIVTLLGGQLDGLALSVPGEASLPLGQPALMFLYRGKDGGDMHVVGMAQGVMPMQSQQGTLMIIPGGSGSALVDRGDDGVLRDAPAAMMQPEPAASVLDRVRALVAASK